MYKILCPKCQNHSYSSYDSGTWNCPTCNTVLATASLLDSESSKRKSPKFFVIKNDQVANYQITPYIFKSLD